MTPNLVLLNMNQAGGHMVTIVFHSIECHWIQLFFAWYFPSCYPHNAQLFDLLLLTLLFPSALKADSALKALKLPELPERHLSSGTQSPNDAAALTEGCIDHPERAAPSNPGLKSSIQVIWLISRSPTWPWKLDLSKRSWISLGGLEQLGALWRLILPSGSSAYIAPRTL